MKGLNARHLQPPMQQIRMLAQDEATLRRLQKCESLKHQLDIICGAALRTRDWKVCKPAANDGEPVSGDRHDVFRAQADGDPLTHLWSRKFGAYFVSAVEATRIVRLWSRKFGAYFVSAVEATRIVRSVPAHAPPAGLFSLVTLEPAVRSEVQPVETLVVFPDNSHHMHKVFLTHLGTEKLVVFPDNSHHMHKVFLTHLGTEKLSASAWKTVSLTSVDSVEVLLEWWKDLTDGDALAAKARRNMLNNLTVCLTLWSPT
eukprot:s4337_g8.t1